MNSLLIEDISNAYLEHSMVIHNFVIKAGSQIKDSLCRVFGDSVQYQWRENDDKVIIPDASIICNMRDCHPFISGSILSVIWLWR